MQRARARTIGRAPTACVDGWSNIHARARRRSLHAAATGDRWNCNVIIRTNTAPADRHDRLYSALAVGYRACERADQTM